MAACAAPGFQPRSLEPGADEQPSTEPRTVTPPAPEVPRLAAREGPRLAPPCDTVRQRGPIGHDISYERGQQEACAALAAGELTFELYGYPAECTREYGRILHDEFRTTLRGSVGCVVDTASLAYVSGFNAVMEAEFARRYGKDTLAEVGRRACGS